MKFSIVIAAVVSILVSWTPVLSFAQSVTPDSSKEEIDSTNVGFFAGQRFWFSSWDVLLFDARIVTQGSINPVQVVQTDFLSSAEYAVLPVTSLGASFGRWSLAASITPMTDVSIELANRGEVSRSEYDINVSYAVNEYFSTALIYKSGKINNASTVSAFNILADSPKQEVHAWLIGISGRAPATHGVTMYGNVALGPGRVKTTGSELLGSTTSNDIIYSIGEVGISYRLPNIRFGSWSVQLGYRLQSVLIKEVESYTIDLSPAQHVLSTERRDIQSTTQGIIIGLTVGF